MYTPRGRASLFGPDGAPPHEAEPTVGTQSMCRVDEKRSFQKVMSTRKAVKPGNMMEWEHAGVGRLASVDAALMTRWLLSEVGKR